MIPNTPLHQFKDGFGSDREPTELELSTQARKSRIEWGVYFLRAANTFGNTQDMAQARVNVEGLYRSNYPAQDSGRVAVTAEVVPVSTPQAPEAATPKPDLDNTAEFDPATAMMQYNQGVVRQLTPQESLMDEARKNIGAYALPIAELNNDFQTTNR